MYEGIGKRVKATINGTTMVYIGNHTAPGDPNPRDFKWNDTTSALTKYYYAGNTRVAVRGTYLRYLLSDHLGSTTVTATGVGDYLSELRYKPFGETRFSDGTTPTKRHFQGQTDESAIGLYFFNARWYDSSIGRFTSADTDVPESQGVQAWDRYAFVNNNPVRYTDPTGHMICDMDGYCGSAAGLAERREKELLALPEPLDQLETNLWDLVPAVSNIRGVIRGGQVSNWASEQPGFQEQQVTLQGWYNNCYGQCHYADAVGLGPSYPTVGGPMPSTPLVDTFSEGAGEIAGNVVDIGLTIATGAVVRILPEPKFDTPRFGIRLAPFGNAGKGPLASQLPHFHFRVGPQFGQSYPGLGWHWHHPWEDITRLINMFLK